MVTTRGKATYADIEALPEHLVGEILEGELVVSPRPRSRHAHAANIVSNDLTGPFQRQRGGPGGWWILPEPELHLGPHVIVPDLAAWRRERMPVIPDEPFLQLAPDWVCEIASPSTARVDRTVKTRIYAAASVSSLWVVDPSARSLEVFRLVDGRWSLMSTHSDEDRVRAEPFDAIELDLAAWWLPEPEAP
jgi:Uma2 family endonuclease